MRAMLNDATSIICHFNRSGWTATCVYLFRLLYQESPPWTTTRMLGMEFFRISQMFYMHEQKVLEFSAQINSISLIIISMVDTCSNFTPFSEILCISMRKFHSTGIMKKYHRNWQWKHLDFIFALIKCVNRLQQFPLRHTQQNCNGFNRRPCCSGFKFRTLKQYRV